MSEARHVASAQERAERAARVAEKVESVKHQIMNQIALLQIMPNGKPMRDCTGDELVEFGERLLREGKRKKKEEAATKK